MAAKENFYPCKNKKVMAGYSLHIGGTVQDPGSAQAALDASYRLPGSRGPDSRLRYPRGRRWHRKSMLFGGEGVFFAGLMFRAWRVPAAACLIAPGRKARAGSRSRPAWAKRTLAANHFVWLTEGYQAPSLRKREFSKVSIHTLSTLKFRATISRCRHWSNPRRSTASQPGVGTRQRRRTTAT